MVCLKNVLNTATWTCLHSVIQEEFCSPITAVGTSPVLLQSFILCSFFLSILLIVEHQPRFPIASTLIMGKTDRKQTQIRAWKATSCKSKHKATGESKHKKQPSFDATKFEATNDDDLRHSKWRDQFRQLCEFKVQFGHCLVPTGKHSANPNLGNWVATQRTASRLHHDGTPSRMPAERIRALNGIGFNWEGTNASWDARLEQLTEFKVQFGHCRVPRQYAAHPKLSTWVSTQRNAYKLYQGGKPSPMTEESIRELESIGFDWGTTKTDWSTRFQQLCEFKVQFGNCLVPRQYTANPKLGTWVMTQRRNHKLQKEGKQSPITEESIRELESIGFDWETSQTDWSARFQQLCEFKAQFANCLVPHQYAANPKLGAWVSKQRHNYKLQKKGKPSAMTAERIRALEIVGFDWEVFLSE